MGIVRSDIRLQWVIVAGIAFLAHAVISVQLRISPKDTTIQPGRNVSILCSSDVPLNYCRIKLPGMENAYSLSKRTRPTEHFAYHGSGLENGECGITLFAVDDKVNGVIHCTASTDEHHEEIADRMKLTVIRPAKPPYFIFVPAPSKRNPHVYREDFVLRTTCVVEGGRPVAKVSWFLDQEVVSKGLKQAVIVEDKQNLFTITQEFARRLTWKDNGKQLRCVAEQAHLDPTTETAVTLNVLFAPRSVKSPINLYGFAINSTASVIIEVSVNPRPKFSWVVGGIELSEGSKSADGKLEVMPAENMGPGTWKAVLIINYLTEKDINTDYFLKAKNTEGETKYKVFISTEAEPKSLSAGVSIAIGVSVCTIFILFIVGCVIVRRRKHKQVTAQII